MSATKCYECDSDLIGPLCPVCAHDNTAEQKRIVELETALREANDRLRELGDTTLHPVRQKIWKLIGETTI